MVIYSSSSSSLPSSAAHWFDCAAGAGPFPRTNFFPRTVSTGGGRGASHISQTDASAALTNVHRSQLQPTQTLIFFVLARAAWRVFDIRNV